MKLSIFTPMPPERTGVAHYASMLIPALRKRADVEVVARGGSASGVPVYQLGNNPHHEWIYREAMQTPGVIVLHDLVLHHLIVEMTLARGDAAGYIEALRANHGEAGAAWARGRAAGMHTEMGNFLFPASIDVAQRARSVIVHNRYAADRLRSFGVTTPIHVVPHPYEPIAKAGKKAGVIGMFGFLTSAKRAEVVLEAFRRTKGKKLLVVGEPAPNIDVSAFRAEDITFTGYVEDFDRYYGEVDRLVNLRYPTAGETSGTLIRAFAAGKPVAVSDYAQFAELPDDCVCKIPLGEGEVDALTEFFERDLPDPSAAQKKWLEENATLDQTVDGYLKAIHALTASGQRVREAAVRGTIALFPRMQLVNMRGNRATIKNTGDTILRARSYGEPAYRIIVKSGEFSRWLELPRDLAPGESTTIDIPAPPGLVTFHHALESIPMLDPEPWGRGAIQ